MAAPLVVVGLDGATWDLVEPWIADGTLPSLARLRARGAWARLASTVPAATFPAWTSLVTGVNPGRHGVLDFTERVPGTYRVRFANGSRRRVPALWTRYRAAGLRTAVLTVPGTYPPEPVDGVMVSGWDSPLATAVDGSCVHPPAFWDEIRRTIGRLPFADFQEMDTGAGWHADARVRLLDGIERRTRLVLHCLASARWDLLVAVFGESDTVAHHFWRFHDAGSPRHEPSPHAGAVRDVYRALDVAVGAIVDAAPCDATVAVVSDHGSGGAGDLAVHLNRRLHECGLLAFAPTSPAWPARVRRTALGAVPLRWQGPLLRRMPGVSGAVESAARFAGIAWRGTRAYSEELDYAPSVWLNLAGREPDGTVAARDYAAVREEVVRALVGWRHADGRPVVARVWRREEVLSGPSTDEAPDLFLDLALVDGYSPSCLRSGTPGPSVRRLERTEWDGGRGAGMNGAHRRDGVLLLAGTGVAAAGDVGTCAIVDVVPTVLAAVGRPVPEGLDGVPCARALAGAPRFVPDDVDAPPSAPRSYDAGEAGEIAARLAALGYVEVGR